MRLADYLFRHLADSGVRQVFMVTGGGAMHLNDALRRESRLRFVCNHHEQASAMAAEGFARESGLLAVVSVTSGPGALNALNGVFGAFTDSIPMIVVSGQVKRETFKVSHRRADLRQLGDQEVDIGSMVKGITKYAAVVDDPADIRYHLEKALYLAQSGRQGPCWLDIPIDVQSADIDPAVLRSYEPPREALAVATAAVPAACREVLNAIRKAERPVILAGTGVRLAGSTDALVAFAEKLGIPVTTAWTHDLIESDHPLFCGRPGTIGTRAGNFVVQSADLVLVLGSRLNIRQVSYNWRAFAPHARVIQVDIDPSELDKPTVRPHLPIAADLRDFLAECNRLLASDASLAADHREWVRWCKERQLKYPQVLPTHRTTANGINPYFFVEQLFELLRADDTVVCANGAATVMTFQAARIRRGQRVFSNSGAASMGWDLPAAIGAACARDGRRTICIAGDGSVQMNIQELQTVVHNQLPVKLFVLSNGGYLSIRTTQRGFFGAVIGEGPASGVSFPDLVEVARAYRLPAMRAQGHQFASTVAAALDAPGPCLVDVVVDPEQAMEPRTSSRQLPDGRIVSAPLHDMFPFLPRSELADNLLGPVKNEIVGG